MSKEKPKHQQSIEIPKPILFTAKVAQFISKKAATNFAMKLFMTPMKHRMPSRELEMDTKSEQVLVTIPAIKKDVMVYHYGKSDKKILLVHGWSGRGTQLVKIADEFLKLGYSTVSFDAPAHGKSSGKTSHMREFVQTILHLQQLYGPFEYAVGHSLGGMALLNAVKRGLVLHKLVVIGSGDVVEDILNDFVLKLQMKLTIAAEMKVQLEKRLGETLNSYSAYIASEEVPIPVLVIHDEDDHDVPVSAAHHIYEHLKDGQLMITKSLGHRKILGDSKVIERIVKFIKN
ncbi:alpha/beta hydrolase [Flavobacterium sp. '19STA2R22 D10 B1']|uniref:alpha/beta hydrolase n=1 Tax=Flavobacterium aerium TaxID=3037261 RepID=UPI00278C108F|nr:alpha/beta hydrolase [Flavobacterium sp. '19STA2R22 D10 B1']